MNKKTIILLLIIAIAVIIITCILMMALGCEVKTIFLFLLSAFVIGGAGLLFSKLTGLKDIEGTAIFILIALILYKIFN